MKVVTLRDFRDRATEMMRSTDIVMVTRDGRPAGFFIPWSRPDIPNDVRRGIFAELAAAAAAELSKRKVTEEEVLADFAAARPSRS